MDIKIDNGLKEYNLNDAVIVRFNPTDVTFANKLYDAFASLEAKQNEPVPEDRVFEWFAERDVEMRDTINDLFGVDVCNPLFGTMNVYALSGGMPLWANLLFAIIDEMDESVKKEQKVHKERISKYTKKYHR